MNLLKKIKLSVLTASLLLGSSVFGAISVGDTKYNIEVGQDEDGYNVYAESVNENLFVTYTDYNGGNRISKAFVVAPDGTKTAFPNTTLSPTTNDNSDTIIYYGLEDGNILINWYSSSSGKGFTDNYFKVIDPNGNDVVSATKINTLAGDLNRFSVFKQLSDGTILFVWATGGSDYALRRFNTDGSAVDTNQISITSTAGLSGSQYYHDVAINDTGFMIVWNAYNYNGYLGMMFENVSPTPTQINGSNYFTFATTTAIETSNKTQSISTMLDGNYFVLFQGNPTGEVIDRDLRYQIINGQTGELIGSDVLMTTYYTWGGFSQPIFFDDSFYLYHWYDDGTNTGEYSRFYDFSGNSLGDVTYPTIIDQYGNYMPFKDVDGNLAWAIEDDDDGDGNWDVWLLRQSTVIPISGSNRDSDANLIAGTTVDESSMISISSTVDTESEKVNLFDFTISDGGTSDGLPTDISKIVVHTSGTADFSKVTWLLNGSNATNIMGVYSSSSNTITFSGLSISVADGGNETYSISGYFNDNTGLIDNSTFGLSIDGDSDITVDTSKTTFGVTNAVTNNLNTKVDITATKLIFIIMPNR